MIRWCSYCQAFLGEREPYISFAITHGICERCDARLEANDDLVAEYDSAIRLYRELFAAARAGDRRQGIALVERARAAGFESTGVAIGLIQPALNEIGRKWEEGSVTVADEHRFTDWCESMLAQLERPPLPHEPLELLILNAPGNRHALGPRMAELALLEAGIRVEAILPDLPLGEIVQLARDLHPAWIGFSCALPDHVQKSAIVIRRLADSGFTGRVIVSGHAVRANPAMWDELDAHVCFTVEQARDLIRTAEGPLLRGSPE